MNTPNGNFIETSIPNDNATITLNIAGKESTMKFADFKALVTPEPAPIPEAPYKVYTALVSQSGGDDILGIWGNGEGDLTSVTKGATVEIVSNPNNTDYSSIGAPNSSEGTYFVLTQDISYEDLDVDTIFDVNLGSPVVTVLENTIGDIWFTYNDVGEYSITSNGLFTAGKTFSFNNNVRYLDPVNDTFFILRVSPELTTDIALATITDGLNFEDNFLEEQLIEIRVYN